MTDDLIAFLTARLDEDDQRARKLLCRAQNVSLELQEPKLLGRHIPGWDSWGDVEKLCERALRKVEAAQAILAEHEGPCCVKTVECGEVAAWYGAGSPKPDPCLTLRILAAIWQDHAGYRQEWAPEKEDAEP
jgi:hypothetical protein